MRQHPRKTIAAVAAAALLIPAALTTASADAGVRHGNGHGHGNGHAPKVVVDQLDNPRQLAVGPGGTLYVAEAGSGGTTCTGTGEEAQCIGDTAAITKIRHPWRKDARARTVVDVLPSTAGPDGSFAVGANGVSVNRRGTVYGVVSGAPDVGTPTGDLVGKLFKVKNGTPRVVADITGYEQANDPDGQGVDSNPYSVLALRKRVLVADAAANAVLSVGHRGRISVFHVFPNITTGECAGQPNDGGTTGCDFVPTALAAGPHGTVYVTGLASEVEGEGRVVQLSKRGNVLRSWRGFTTPVGVAVKGSTFYVSELLANADFSQPDPPTIGQVTKVTKNRRSSRVVPLPAGLAIVRGKLYVAAYSVAPASGLFGNPAWNGQIWRMHL
jgi:hypothetical protein